MAIAYVRQDLGIFQEDYTKIMQAIGHESVQSRTKVGKFTLLDRETDPHFPYQGRVKQIFYCFSEEVSGSPCLISVALRGKATHSEIQTEKAIYERLAQVVEIAQPLQIEQIGEFYYFILELFNEGSLTEFIINHHQVFQQWNRDWILYKLAHAIQKCHDEGIVLRDLKADNVLVRKLPNGELDLKITDFGLSLHLPTASEVERRLCCGTSEYLAPEVFDHIVEKKNFPPVHYSTDLWALGTIFFGMHRLEMCLSDQQIEKGMKGIEKPQFPKFHSMDFGPLTCEGRDLLHLNPQGRSPAGWIAKRVATIYRRLYAELPPSYVLPAANPLIFTDMLVMLKQIQTKTGESIFEKVHAYL